jgi:CRP-like cAMP-binding protein
MCMIAPLIRSVDIFRSLTDRELSRLADVAEAVSVPAQTIIIRQGDEADAMYVLMALDGLLMAS